MNIINSLFENNSLSNVKDIKVKAGNTCLCHTGTSGNLTLFNTVFKLNKADYESHCLYFIGV